MPLAPSRCIHSRLDTVLSQHHAPIGGLEDQIIILSAPVTISLYMVDTCSAVHTYVHIHTRYTNVAGNERRNAKRNFANMSRYLTSLLDLYCGCRLTGDVHVAVVIKRDICWAETAAGVRGSNNHTDARSACIAIPSKASFTCTLVPSARRRARHINAGAIGVGHCRTWVAACTPIHI
jgi:hypothetical protein